MRILFYTHSARAFSSTLIGNLHELSTAFPVVLVAEPLAERHRELLRDKSLFPGLERIVWVNCLKFSVRDLVANNRGWHRLAERLVEEARPDVVVAENDMMSLFEMYLMRAARRRSVATVTIQSMAEFSEADNLKWLELLQRHPPGARSSRTLGELRVLKRSGDSTRAEEAPGEMRCRYLLRWPCRSF